MSKKLIITEEERNNIKSLYNVNEIFDTQTIINRLLKRLDDKFKKPESESNINSSNNSSNVKTITTTDDEFYKKVLSCIGAEPTKDNMTFMYAWRQAEGGKATNNPFNTTQKMPGATNYNSVGVKNYKSSEDGIQATCKTLNNGRYSDIVTGLKNDVGLSELSKMESLDVWGTGDLLAQVANGYLKGNTPKPPAIA